MVASGTRKALAICWVVMPTTARSVSARRASTLSAGWQQPNNIGSRSSAVRCPGPAPIAPPGPQRNDDRLLHGLLGNIKVAEAALQLSNDQAGFSADNAG